MTGNANRPPEQRRAYHAPIRREQAELTRQRILDAARHLFAERGYTATTVEAIAAQAEVAVPTLYTTFGAKRHILASLVLQLKERYAVATRIRALLAASDPVHQLREGAHVSREFTSAAWDVIAVLDAARKTDPELAELWDQVEGARLRDQQEFVAQFARAGVLRPGLDPQRAADLYWAISSHHLYSLLVIERGWSDDEYEGWLAATLEDLLLR